MELYIVATVLVTSIMMALCYIKAKAERKVPVNWPMIGMLPAFLSNMSNIYDYGAKVVIDNGGTFRFRVPWMSKDLVEVVTCTPTNIEHILKTHFRNFPRGPYYREVFRDIFEDGLVNADDDVWRRQRKAVSIALNNSRETTLNICKELVQKKLISVLEQAKEKKYPLDFQDLFLRLKFDTMCIALFGKNPQSLSLDLPDFPFPTAFSEAVETFPYRMIFPTFLWKLMKLMNIGFERKIRKTGGVINECISEMIRVRLEELNNTDVFPQGDSLANFMKLEVDSGRSPSQKTLKGLCMSMILAGRDTAASLTWFFWLLSMHPQVEEKILSELSMVSKTSGIGCEYFGAKELANLNYSQAALSEAMRLYPAVPLLYRQAMEDNVLPDGTLVRKDSKLVVFIYATNRMESLWGQDAGKFRPERWINKDGLYVKEEEYKYPVFNGGPRLCLGREIAYMTMKYVVANIVERYKVNVVAGHPVKPEFGLALCMKYGLKVTLQSREDVL